MIKLRGVSEIIKPVNLYYMNIYELEVDNIKNLKNMDSNTEVKYREIEYNDILEIAKLRNNERLKEFKKIIKQKSIGVLAYKDNEIIGYGWVKLNKCYDKFFHISEKTGYLSSFYVKPEWRGNGIYPQLINMLIKIAKKNFNISYYLIGIQKNNNSSIKGASKVGFRYKYTKKILRAFKLTIPKHTI